MIRIALLDDEKDQREVTAALLERYFPSIRSYLHRCGRSSPVLSC